MVKMKCTYCNEEFDLKEKYPITWNYKLKNPRYCSYWCSGRAGNLRMKGLKAYKNITDTDREYINRIKRLG